MTGGDGRAADGALERAAHDRFGRHLAGLLGVECEVPVRRSHGLFDDWNLDSLLVFQLIVTVEAMADCMLPPDEIPEMYTVGDAFDYYASLRRSAADEP